MRRCLLFPMLSVLGATFTLHAGTVAISASGTGASASDSGGDFGQLGSYFAGLTTIGAGDVQWRDHFDFAIPLLNAPLLGATFALDQPGSGFSPADGTDTTHIFSVLGLGADHSFTAIGAGTFYASTTLNAATDGTTVYIQLSGAALADILLAQGGVFHLGGVDSGESASASDHWIGDWLGTGGVSGQSQLLLDIAPEPASWLMMLGALVGLAAPVRRRARQR